MKLEIKKLGLLQLMQKLQEVDYSPILEGIEFEELKEKVKEETKQLK